MRWVIATDLDETLLERETYSFEPARPLLRELKERGVPVVICTSKTRAEVECDRADMGITDPFVVENGGASYAQDLEIGPRAGDGLFTATLGTPYPVLLDGLEVLKKKTRGAVAGFHDMTDEEVAELTSLPLSRAALARRREFDEPFIFRRDQEEFEPSLADFLKDTALQVSRGGRLFHLHGANDKGRALRVILDAYRSRWGRIKTIGVGDSLQDIPMLEVTDVPVVMRKADGEPDAAVLGRIRRAQVSEFPGPRGWAGAIVRLLK